MVDFFNLAEIIRFVFPLKRVLAKRKNQFRKIDLKTNPRREENKIFIPVSQNNLLK